MDRLAGDLAATDPDKKGWSPRNPEYRRAFAAAWPEHALVQEAPAPLTWDHNLALLERLGDAQIRHQGGNWGYRDTTHQDDGGHEIKTT